MILAKRTIKLCGKYKLVERVDKYVYSDKTPRYFYFVGLYQGRIYVSGNDSEKITEETAKEFEGFLKEKGVKNAR